MGIRTPVYICLLVLASFTYSIATEGPQTKLRELYTNKQYFELREALEHGRLKGHISSH